MIIIEYQENKESEDGDDFTYREIVDKVLFFWEVFVNFLKLIRYCILLVVTAIENTLLKSSIYVQCFQEIQAKKSTLNMPTPSTTRSFNSLMKKDSSVECVRKLHKTPTNGIDVKNVLNIQLNDLNFLDSDINNEVNSSRNSPASTHNFGKNGDRKTSALKEVPPDTKKKKKDEVDPFKVAQYREAILKYSRISYSDFTSLFNKFVREKGRDFSKDDLLHWLSRFTKFIYLKKEISGEPSELREQLALRAIQSKRNSLVDRLYTLREPSEINQSLEDFSEHLKTSYLNPVKKLINVIRGGAGDINIFGKEKSGHENTSANKAEGSNFHNAEINDESNISGIPKSSIIHQNSNTTRTETLDLEQEKVYQDETRNEHLQQTIYVNRKKKTPKIHKKQNENESKQCRDLIDIENMYQISKFHFQKVDDFPPPKRDPTTLTKSDVYSTKNGFVKVSQHLDTSITKKQETNRIQQRSSINSFIDYFDESDPLPEGTEVKPLPPGGLDEVIKTNNEYADRELMRSLLEYEKENPLYGTTKDTSTTSFASDSKDIIFKGDPKVLAKELNDAMAIEHQNRFKAFQVLPDTLPKTQQNVDILSPKQVNFDFASPGSINPFVPEEKKTTPRERSSKNNVTRNNKTKNHGTRPIIETMNKEPGNKMRRFVPVRRRLNKQLQDTGKESVVKEKQPKEIQETGPKDIKFENNELLRKRVKDEKGRGDAIKGKASECPCKKSQEPNEANIKDKAHKISKCCDSRGNSIQIQETGRDDIFIQCKDRHIDRTQISSDQQLFDQLSPLSFIDTDINENEAVEAVKGPVYMETNATIDYSRLVVEPTHGDRPNKKKLQCRIKEKIKTKGEANKHLKAKKEKPAYYFEEENLDSTVEDGPENELEDSMTEPNEEHNTSTPVVYATEQPQILDNREYMMVPEEIIRITDPRLKDIEDKYSVASTADKKDKKKRKDKKGKVQKSIPISFVSDFHL